MSATTRLALPFIAPQQAQKQVTYNEAMALLDVLVQPVVKSRTLTAPPSSPTVGDAYVVAIGATGAWAAKDGQFAIWRGAWEFRAPATGWLTYVEDTAQLALYEAGAWSSFYEEGSWTPVLSFGGASAGITYSAHAGRYTKTGRQVTVSATITLTSKGSSAGTAEIGALPFAAANDGIPAGLAVGHASGFASVAGAVIGKVEPNTSKCSLFQSANGAAVALTDANFGSGSSLTFTASYDAG
jgi:hypothetical protein